MKAKAAVFLEPSKPMEIREYPLPDVEPDAVLVKLRYANTCGSDLHQRTQNKYPFDKIISHKFNFERINDAFEFAARGEAIRVALEF